MHNIEEESSTAPRFPVATGWPDTRHAALTVFVVADRFAVFAEGTSVTTWSELVERIARDELSGPVRLLAGQGVSRRDWAWLGDRVTASCDEDVVLGPLPPEPLYRGDTLNQRQANVLIGDLCRIAEDRWACELVIGDDTELIQDHTALRQHIPGMLLMEATCQMYIAVTSRVVDARWPDIDFYMVMQRFRIEFDRYVFPLPAQLLMSVTSDRSREDRVRFNMSVTIEQAGHTCARASWSCQRIVRDTIYAIENHRACQTLAAATQPVRTQEVTA